MRKYLYVITVISVFICSMLSCAMASGSLYYQSPGDRNMTIQYQYDPVFDSRKAGFDTRFLLQDGKPAGNWNENCLAQGGCHLFSYAHAIQWIMGDSLGGKDLLAALVNVC